MAGPGPRTHSRVLWSPLLGSPQSHESPPLFWSSSTRRRTQSGTRGPETGLHEIEACAATVDKKIFLAPLVGCSKYSIFKLVNLSTQLQVKICVTTSTFPIQAPQGLTAGPHDQGLKASSAMR